MDIEIFFRLGFIFSIKKITVPPLVTEINGVTFTNCSSLEEINLPYGIKIKSNAIKENHARINYY